MSLPTPYIGHLTEEDYEHVYEPAGERGQRRPSLIGPEDSFILLDALEADTIPLRAARPSLCVEIGCDGSSMLRLPGHTAHRPSGRAQVSYRRSSCSC
jgi:hypothetical protein